MSLLLQSDYWARFKAATGWRTLQPAPPGGIALARRAGPFLLAYLPYAFGRAADHSAVEGPAPSRDEVTTAQVYCDALSSDARAGTERLRPVVVRWDVPWPASEGLSRMLSAAGFTRSPTRVQPPDTTIVDLRPNPEAILASMKSKTRYNVRLGPKRGVEVRCAATSFDDRDYTPAVGEFYRLYRRTAARDRITIHPQRYYETAFRIARDLARRQLGTAAPAPPELVLYQADYAGELLAAIVVARWRGTATYLYGASSSRYRNLMAPYALQWRAMRDAKITGCQSYDLFGIPPTDDPTHPMHGLYRVKVGFGGNILHRAGAWDYIARPLAGRAFRRIEAARQWYYHGPYKRAAGVGRALGRLSHRGDHRSGADGTDRR